jgi:hypothetical protein
MLTKLEADRADVEQTLLRISGAIQVLEELLTPTPETPGSDGELPATPLASPPPSPKAG